VRVRILGSAAGGGVPQWNCRCANCEAVRSGSGAVEPRTQSSVAVSGDGRHWFLLNVSADVRQQILAFPSLVPSGGQGRATAIAGCVLTDAEIDHTSGLLQLREGGAFPILSTPLVRRWLNSSLSIETLLGRFAERPWLELPLDDPVQPPLPDGTPAGLSVRAFEVDRHVPRFIPDDPAQAVGSVIGLEIRDERTGGKLVYAPCLASVGEGLAAATEGADGILIDGTFWDDDELIRAGFSDRSARTMGHLPVGGPEGSLSWLEGVRAPQRIYVHINNTNPMLNRHGPEFHEVESRGIRVGVDGFVFDL
jgi:pyrroloquinoline quinone biosynthesis protein B